MRSNSGLNCDDEKNDMMNNRSGAYNEHNGCVERKLQQN